MITRRPALLLRRVLGRRPLSSTSTTTGGDAAAANADASGGKGGKGGATAMEGALRGKSRRELAAFHPLLRTAQVAEALRQGFQEGRLPARCTGSNSSSSTNSSDGRADVEAALRLARARPSLLVPLAGSVGFGLRCLAQLLPGTAPVAKGVLGSIEEAMDDGVRGLIAMEQQRGGESQAAGAAAVKELLKGRRDAVAGAEATDGVAGAAGAAGAGAGMAVDPVAFVCRALLKGAERV